MPLFDGKIVIDAPPSIVWNEVQRLINIGLITSQEQYQYLVISEGELVYIYTLKELDGDSTCLRHVVETDTRASEALRKIEEPQAALDSPASLSERNTQSDAGAIQDILNIPLDPLSTIQGRGWQQLTEIKKEAEAGVTGLRSVESLSQISEPLTVSAAGADPTVETGLEAPLIISGRPEPLGEAPWKPAALTLMALIFGFGAAGIVAGINWQRLGQPQRMWPTILLSVAGFVSLIALIILVPVPEYLYWVIGLVSLGAGVLLASLQKTAYQSWTTEYGKRSLQESGCIIPLAIGIGGIVLLLGAVFLGPEIFSTAPAISHYNQGVEYQSQGQLDLALEAYSLAIELDPQYVDAHINRGAVYLLQDRYLLALEDTNKALDIDPRSGMAHNNRGAVYIMLGKNDEALVELTAAIDYAPRLSFPYVLRGALYIDLGEMEKASSDFEQALDLGLAPDAKIYVETKLEAISP